MSEALVVTLDDIKKAQIVLKQFLEKTPLLRNDWLSRRFECEFYLKLENLQPVGSFKIRGALNKLSSLSKEELKKGVIAASAGNHAQGVAWAARHFKTKATIVMPVDAPLTKVQSTQTLGAKVVLHGKNYDDAYEHSLKVEKTSGGVFVHPFEDANVIAGQGTVGLEILEQCPKVDLVLTSLGGGGLMAGVGTAIKALKPAVQLVGCQASGAKALIDSIRQNKVIRYPQVDTFADGIKTNRPSLKMLEILKPLLSQMEDVDDDAIAIGVLQAMERAHVIAEGAGAVPIAVAEQMANGDADNKIKGKHVVAVVSGGNIDVNVLSKIIDLGLVRDGRRLRLNVFLLDKPGSLLHLARLVAKHKANVLQVIHERNDATVGVNETCVELTLETRGAEHSLSIVKALKVILPRVEVLD